MGNKRVMLRLKVKIGLAVKVFGSTELFSRVVSWGRDYNNCMRYLKQNILEVLSFIPYTTRKKIIIQSGSTCKYLKVLQIFKDGLSYELNI